MFFINEMNIFFFVFILLWPRLIESTNKPFKWTMDGYCSGDDQVEKTVSGGSWQAQQRDCNEKCLNAGYNGFTFGWSGWRCFCERGGKYSGFDSYGLGGACGDGVKDIYGGMKNYGSGLVQDDSYSKYQSYCGDGNIDTGYQCDVCPSGQYRSGDSFHPRACNECPKGKYQPSVGKAACIKCPPGRTASGNGQTACETCEVGRFNPLYGQDQCNDCSNGRYQNQVGQGNCDECPPGKYIEFEKSITCKLCDIGKYQVQFGQAECKTCPAGQYQNSIGQSKCSGRGGEGFKKLARELSKVQNVCRDDKSSAEIWLSNAIQVGQLYGLASTSLRADRVDVRDDMTSKTLNAFTATGDGLQIDTSDDAINGTVPSGSIYMSGIRQDQSDLFESGVVDISLADNTQKGIVIETAGGLVIGSSGLETSVTEATAKTQILVRKDDGVPGSGRMRVDGKINVLGADSTLVGPVYILDGKRLDPDTVEQFGYSVYTTDSEVKKVSLSTTHTIFTPQIVAASDKRIKKDIEPVPDSEALAILRMLDAKRYRYRDMLKRGLNHTIGFIAQDVFETIPEAVTKMTDAIPNIMQGVHVTWSDDGTRMHLAESVDPGHMYRFYVSDSKVSEKMFEWFTVDGISFETPKKFERVFLYGEIVSDFHTIDKQKIFAVAYAALQELDKQNERIGRRVQTLAYIDGLRAIADTQEQQISRLEQLITL